MAIDKGYNEEQRNSEMSSGSAWTGYPPEYGKPDDHTANPSGDDGYNGGGQSASGDGASKRGLARCCPT